MSAFISVGNAKQPFKRLLALVDVLAKDGCLTPPIMVQHGHTPFTSDLCSYTRFMGMDEFVRWMRESTIIITHCGAGSVLHAMSINKVPIVMPRKASYGEHIDDHQIELAMELEKDGSVYVANNLKEMRERIACVVKGSGIYPIPRRGTVICDYLRRDLEDI